MRAADAFRLLHRFTKPGGDWAEIRESTVSTFGMIEYVVYVNGSFIGGERVHNDRRAEYTAMLEERTQQFRLAGWAEEGAVPIKPSPSWHGDHNPPSVPKKLAN